MNLFGISLGKEKAAPFPQFRDTVRLALRRANPGAKVDNTENGFILMIEGRPPTACNLRNLYAAYSKTPSDRDALITQWLSTVVTEVPDQTWSEAKMTLRPVLKSADYIQQARASMTKDKDPDDLPASPFVGDLFAIVMREIGATLTGVTQKQLEEWGVTLEQAMTESLNNMNMSPMPTPTNALLAGGTGRKNTKDQEEVGLVFDGGHMTATWLLAERFRDYLAQRLQGDYVVFVPSRSRLVAVRADEPGLIAQMTQANRNYRNLPYWLTQQAFHVSGAMTGGIVTVYQPSGLGSVGDRLDPNSQFAGSAAAPAAPAPAPGNSSRRLQPVDLSAWGGGLTESTSDAESPTPWNRGR